MVKMKLHVKLAEYRMTQKELSEKTGIRQPTISAYCNDTWKTISKINLDILCDFFDCSIEDLIEYVPNKENDKRNLMLENDNKKELYLNELDSIIEKYRRKLTRIENKNNRKKVSLSELDSIIDKYRNK